MIYYDAYDQLMTGLLTSALLTDVRRRAMEQALAWDMAAGNYMPYPGELSPAPKTEEAIQSYYRLLRLTEPIGPQIIKTRLWGAIGDVQWGDPQDAPSTTEAGEAAQETSGTEQDADELDDALKAVDLMKLARRGFEQAFVTGITAYWARVDEDEQKPVMTRLGGYLQPMTDPDDVDSVDALLQAWQPEGGGVKGTWTVRVYDYVAKELRIWEKVKDPGKALGLNPTDIRKLDTLPHIAITYLDAAGLPVGEMTQGVHLVRQNMAIQLRIQRVAEMYGFPIPVVKDLAKVPRDFGPGKVVEVGPNGDFDYKFPPGLERLVALLDGNIERVRDNFGLPGGSLGGQTPSGEALKEANARYAQVNKYYASLLSGALTGAATDLAMLLNINPVEVEITPSDPNRQEEIISLVQGLYDSGVIPLKAAARAVQEFVPGWDDDDLEEWVDKNQGNQGGASESRIRQILGGGGLGDLTGGGNGGTGQAG